MYHRKLRNNAVPCLDETYPSLSDLVRSVLGLDLEALANRAPAEAFDHFDLERRLAHVRSSPLALDDTIFGPHSQQVRGYLATIEAFVALGVVRNPVAFLTKKLAAPRIARRAPQGTEMLDTLAECSWGLWLHDQHGGLEAEKLLPDGRGDADFFVNAGAGPLWVDSVSVAPTDRRSDMTEYLVKTVRSKWRSKFGARGTAAALPAAIAVTLLKQQEHVMPALIRDEITGASYAPPASLWSDCPGLQAAWFGTPAWCEGPQRPNVFETWSRPP